MIGKDLAQEIRTFCTMKITNKEIIRTAWAVEEIMKTHEDISGEDTQWYLDRARGNVWDAVNAFVRSVKTFEDVPDDLVSQGELFPGYERLQKSYSVERNGEQEVVPVELLSDEELDAKIETHERAATGHMKHADELRRFKDSRTTEAVNG